MSTKKSHILVNVGVASLDERITNIKYDPTRSLGGVILLSGLVDTQLEFLQWVETLPIRHFETYGTKIVTSTLKRYDVGCLMMQID